MTGLFGEIMKPFIDTGNQFVARPFVAANLSVSPEKTLLKSFNVCNRHYFSKDIIAQCHKEIAEDVVGGYIEEYKKAGKNNTHHAYLFKEGIAKYLGAELQSEKMYAVNRFPFLDDDFVRFAFETPCAGMRIKDIVHPSPLERWRAVSFYVYTIHKYKPQLLHALSSHGYAPREFLLPFGFFKAAASSTCLKAKTFLTKYREFKTEEWTEKLYRTYLFASDNTNNLFSANLKKDFETGAWKSNRFEFAKAAALKLYLDSLGSN